jgi:L,D-transpeptidase catalytic domain
VKSIIAATVCALIVAAGVGWLLKLPPTSHRTASEPLHAARTPASQLPEVTKSRVSLSAAQLDEALASKTLDRPVRSLLEIDKPLHFGEFAWNDTAIGPGPLWIRVDLGSQLISVFRDGHEIGTSVIVYGGDNKETPSGTFHVLARDQNHRSSLYDAPMPYTLRLTGDGVAIHGSIVRWGAATHGCIGVPLEFARRLFDQARVGDEVTIVASKSV